MRMTVMMTTESVKDKPQGSSLVLTTQKGVYESRHKLGEYTNTADLAANLVAPLLAKLDIPVDELIHELIQLDAKMKESETED